MTIDVIHGCVDPLHLIQLGNLIVKLAAAATKRPAAPRRKIDPVLGKSGSCYAAPTPSARKM